MITKIKVDGFRSLVNTEIRLADGLNVIVGSNGSGKTNFVVFLDFLGELLSRGVNAAISAAQGAGSTFSRERFDKDSASLDFEISGVASRTTADEPEEGDQGDPGHLEYRYYCEMAYDRRIPAIYIREELLEVTFTQLPHLVVHRVTSVTDEGENTQVDFSPSNHPVTEEIARYLRLGPGRSQRLAIGEYLSRTVSAGSSLLGMLYQDLYFFDSAYREMIGFRSINVDPTAARMPSAVSLDDEVKSNGSGLAAALYALKRDEPSMSLFSGVYRAGGPRSMPVSSRQQVYSSIISWCREISPDIVDLDVTLDFSEALLQPSAVYEGYQRFPFTRVSDGTVKWIALTTILFSESRYAVVEEPENYLHPMMQMSFVQLCRDILNRNPWRSQFVISTHSLTVLDQCEPDELIIFQTVDGKTKASRAANAESLRVKLANSRFGLGHFYRSGAVRGS